MKENTIKAAVMAALAGLSLYFEAILVPILALVLVMAADYATGMVRAWMTRQLHSRAGVVGIVKKVCYLLVVACGMMVDFILQATLTRVGISYNVTFAFGMMVCIWLVINELISILENLSDIGVPMPAFLKRVVARLKVTVEQRGGDSEKN